MPVDTSSSDINFLSSLSDRVQSRLSGNSTADDVGRSTLLRSLGAQSSMVAIGTPSGTNSSVTTYYKKRARDSGLPTPAYVTWVTTVAGQAYPYSPLYGGPLVEVVVAEIWQV